MNAGFYPAMSGSAAAAEINPSWHRQMPQVTRARNEAEAMRVGKDLERMFRGGPGCLDRDLGWISGALR